MKTGNSVRLIAAMVLTGIALMMAASFFWTVHLTRSELAEIGLTRIERPEGAWLILDPSKTRLRTCTMGERQDVGRGLAAELDPSESCRREIEGQLDSQEAPAEKGAVLENRRSPVKKFKEKVPVATRQSCANGYFALSVFG